MKCPNCTFGQLSGPPYASVCERCWSQFAVVETSVLKSQVEPKPEQSTFATGAVRSADANDVRYDLISPVGLRRLASTYAEGAAKYPPHNWRKGFPFSDLMNHLIRHVELFKAGDTSEDHLAHAAWGLFTLMDFQETMPEMDDRYKKGATP